MRRTVLLHPRDLAVNEAWIVFRLNEAPLEVEQGGNLDVVCLMDAASCYILSNEFYSTQYDEVPMPVAERVMEAARAHAERLPLRLLLSSELGSEQFAQLASRIEIASEQVPDKELKAFVSEARNGFRKHMQRRG